jgi:nucleotide-binding universal stress UspA family protein
MFRRILVPLDRSTRAEQALPIAARIARAAGGSVMLLHVVSISREFGPYLRQAALQREVIDAAIAGATTYLSKAAQAYGLAGVETKVALSSGPEALTILDTAKEQQSDLIIIASHGATGFKRWALGSVAQQVARSSPVPVLVLRERGTVPSSSYPDKTRPLHTVAAVVALDGSQLAEAAILPAANLVAALAAPAQGSLHLTRVVQRPGVDAMLSGRERIDPQQRARASSEAMEYLCKLADDLRAGPGAALNLAITWSITLNHNVADSLIKVAEQGRVDGGTCIFGGCDILVLATHGRSGLQRLALGSVTEHILGRTKLPLLIVRPQREQPELASATHEPVEREQR